MNKEGDDPWFHVTHEHHLISLADLNSKSTRPRHAQPSQRISQANLTKRTVSSKDPVKGRWGKEWNSKLESVGQLNKTGHGQCWPRIKRIQLQKDCASQDMNSINRCSGPQASESTLSDSSCTPECKKTGPSNNGSNCSERLSISSALQDLSIESSNLSSNAHKGKSGYEQAQTSSNTSTCIDSQNDKKNRNSSGASFCSLRPKLRFSYELHLSKSTIDQGVQAVDHRSSVGSVTNRSCLKSGVQVSSRGSTSNLDKESECSGCDQPSSSGSKGESNESNIRLIHCHEAARIIVKDESLPVAVRTRSWSNVRERTTDTMGSHIVPRQQLLSGKGNVQQTKAGKGHMQDSKSQAKPKLGNTIVRSSLVRSKMQDGKWRSVDCDRLQRNTEEGCRRRGPLDCFAQMASGRTRQDLKAQSLSTAVLDRRRTGQTSGGLVPENSLKFDSSEQDLVALVAQHNRKIRTLGTHNGKDVFHAA